MTRRWGLFAALAVAVLTLAGCASMNVRSYLVRKADFIRYHTYDWGPADTYTTGDPRLDNNPFFTERIRTDVEKQLAARGFEKTASGTPELLIHIHASVRQEIDVHGADQQYAYCADCRPYVYDAGTLLLDFVDARTSALVWRGWAEHSVDGEIDNQEWMEKRIDEAVTRILERLPDRL